MISGLMKTLIHDYIREEDLKKKMVEYEPQTR